MLGAGPGGELGVESGADRAPQGGGRGGAEGRGPEREAAPGHGVRRAGRQPGPDAADYLKINSKRVFLT